MALLKDKRTWTITDPLHHDDFVTDRGVIRAGVGGHIQTHDEQLAKEIEQREPWTLVTEHEPFKGEGLRGQSMITVPQMPWKKENREKEQDEGHDGGGHDPRASQGGHERNDEREDGGKECP